MKHTIQTETDNMFMQLLGNVNTPRAISPLYSSVIQAQVNSVIAMVADINVSDEFIIDGLESDIRELEKQLDKYIRVIPYDLNDIKTAHTNLNTIGERIRDDYVTILANCCNTRAERSIYINELDIMMSNDIPEEVIYKRLKEITEKLATEDVHSMTLGEAFAQLDK